MKPLENWTKEELVKSAIKFIYDEHGYDVNEGGSFATPQLVDELYSEWLQSIES